MTKLKWDRDKDKFYEAGLDRGVLYGPGIYLDHLAGVAWNGLTAFDVKADDSSVSAIYFDGVKVFDSVKPGDFAGTIKAITYPDEFDVFQGIDDDGQGLFYDNQPRGTFGLSYRTYVGNVDKGTDFAYKLHILYNLTAMATQTTRNTVTSNIDPIEFGWDVTSVPVVVSGKRPTAHIILDSSKVERDKLLSIENALYGIVDTGGPASPSPNSYLLTIDDIVGILNPGG